MKNTKIKILITLIFLIVLIWGFSILDKDLRFTKTNPVNVIGYKNSGTPNQTFGIPYYTDNFDGANDTTALKSRGYKVFYRGTGTQGISATWFQGQDVVFPSFNGPSTGYVAANYQVVTNANNIDSWLVLPKKNVTTGDSIHFYCRSTLRCTPFSGPVLT